MPATVLLGAAFVAATVLLILGCYFAVRRIVGAEPEEHTKDLAGSVMFRISALHGLILALVFANEIVEYQQLRFEGAVEANAVADIYFDIDRYGAETEPEVQKALYAYLVLASGEEWRGLGGEGRLSAAGWALWDDAYNAVLDLEPATERERSLRAHMLQRIHVIAETRVKRENHAAAPLSRMFWFAAVSGVVLIALAYYAYPPKRANIALISMFGAFTGVILFLIYALSNPFGDPGALRPDARLRLIEQIDANSPPGA